MGSTTQRTPLVPARDAPSSPSSPSSGRAARRRSVISRSLALSTAVTTSTGLDFTSTESPADARPVATRSAASRATSTASSSSVAASGGIEAPEPERFTVHDPAAAHAQAHYPVGVQGFGVDIGGSGIKGCPVDLETGELIGERLRIETPQPSTPEAVYDVVRRMVG